MCLYSVMVAPNSKARIDQSKRETGSLKKSLCEELADHLSPEPLDVLRSSLIVARNHKITITL
jgi:hypothetical protein